MNKRILYIIPSILLVLIAIYSSFHLKSKKPVQQENMQEKAANSSFGVVSAEAEEKIETTTPQPAWDNLADNKIVVDGKISRQYLDLPTSKPTTIIQNPVDLTGYIKYEDRTEGNDIEGIFSDLRVKWPVGKEYYNNYYISKDEKANGDLSGKLTDDLQVKWENGTDYYDTKYMAIGSSTSNDLALDDLTDVEIDTEQLNHADSLVWDYTQNKWISKDLIETSNGLGVSADANGYPLVILGGNLDMDTSIDTTGYTLSFESEVADTPEYFQINENQLTLTTLLNLTSEASLQLPINNEVNTPSTCNSTIKGRIGYDDTLNTVCFCNGTNWLKISDEVTHCYEPGF